MWFYLHKIHEKQSDLVITPIFAWEHGWGEWRTDYKGAWRNFGNDMCSLTLYTGQIYCTLIKLFLKRSITWKIFQHYQLLYRLVGNAIYFFYHNLFWSRMENSFPYQIYSLHRQLKCYICVWTRWILHV